VLALLVACACAPAPAAPTGASAPPSSGAAPPGSAAAPPAGGTGGAAAPAAPAAQIASPPSPAPRLETVKIATQPIPNFAAVFIGRERGYLREEGIEIEEVPFDTSSQNIPAIAAGQIDVGAGGIASGFFNAIAQGISARIVLDLSTVPAEMPWAIALK